MKIRVSNRPGNSGGKKEGVAKKIEIPSEVEPVVKRLSKKYDLDFETVSFTGKPLYFLHIADIEPLVAGKDIFANASDFPFWVKIWEASVVMAHLLSGMDSLKGKRILELGAGLAVPGITAAFFGHEVTVTDYDDEILDFVKVSAAVNNCSSRINCLKLDWLKPDAEKIGVFDCIVGSEILFNEKFFKPLQDVLQTLLAPDGFILLAHSLERKSLAPFLNLCSSDYVISAQKRKIHLGRENFEIVLNRLVPRLQNG